MGIKKAVLLKYESDDIKNLGFTPSENSIKDKIQNDISDIEISDMISMTDFENATISIFYDIFKDTVSSDNSQYYGALRLEVRRNVVDSRFTPVLFEPTVYKDFIYVILKNPDNEYFRAVLEKHTDALIRNFANYYYLKNP